MVACAPSTLVLLNTGSERVQQVHGSKGGVESWAFSRSSLVGVFCLLLGRLLRGYSTKAWLGRQTSRLCTKQTLLVCSSNPVYITNTFGVFGVFFFFFFFFFWLCRNVKGPRRWWQLGWAHCFPGLRVSLMWPCGCWGFYLLLFFPVFRWLDGLVAVVGLWWLRPADEESCVWCSGQHPLCGEQHSA